ncbi:hypothetical protein BTN49_2725 [Candidatus Enterovibrio escicola]|uniref:Uncharacterized protein n=1 Tax=Candidatus Enterovibrio escicola TaxID=1927127 RepID=A0A2A5T0M8_9GAMM|nr:hypothetical protein BTN49_2725 [Candidatus Enterovibrio escacola]
MKREEAHIPHLYLSCFLHLLIYQQIILEEVYPVCLPLD